MAEQEKKSPEKGRVDVEVEVEPVDKHDPDNKSYQEKVAENLEKNVTDAIGRNKGGGTRRQLDAAEDEVDKAKKQADPEQIKKIRVKVKIDDEEGDQTTRQKIVTPKGKE